MIKRWLSAQKLIAMADASGDGEVNFEELVHLKELLGIDVTSDQLAEAFEVTLSPLLHSYQHPSIHVCSAGVGHGPLWHCVS